MLLSNHAPAHHQWDSVAALYVAQLLKFTLFSMLAVLLVLEGCKAQRRRNDVVIPSPFSVYIAIVV
jgi:hypothetical protein